MNGYRIPNDENVVRVGGRVQLCVGGQWTDFCSIDVNNHNRWHQSDIDVACRQLRNENSCESSSVAYSNHIGLRMLKT